jgi:hypothetical protein
MPPGHAGCLPPQEKRDRQAGTDEPIVFFPHARAWRTPNNQHQVPTVLLSEPIGKYKYCPKNFSVQWICNEVFWDYEQILNNFQLMLLYLQENGNCVTVWRGNNRKTITNLSRNSQVSKITMCLTIGVQFSAGARIVSSSPLTGFHTASYITDLFQGG